MDDDQRRMMMAQMLQSQGGQQGQMVGRHYVSNPMGQMSSLLGAYLGRQQAPNQMQTQESIQGKLY